MIQIRNVLDFTDIVDVRRDLIYLKGKRYRAVVTADPINFSLLSQGEQEALENSFGSVLMSINYPVQILMLTRKVDLRESINVFRANLNNIPDTMFQYEQALEEFLGHFASQTIISESYIIVPDDKSGDEEKARSEIMRRVQGLIEGLSKCGLSPRMLNTQELIEFLYRFFNRDSSVRANDLIENGALELVKGGVSAAFDS